MTESHASPSKTMEMLRTGKGVGQRFNLSGDIAIDDEINRFKDTNTDNYEVIVKGVIEQILNTKLEGDLISELEDGIILCELFEKLVPDRTIKKPAKSKNLSFFQKRDNLSKFTNACRSISIPDVLLITSSYFENRNKNLLVSGLVTFFIWVLNLGIPDTSKHVTISSVLKASNGGSIDTSINILARRLSNRANGVVDEEDEQMVEDETHQSRDSMEEEKELIAHQQHTVENKRDIVHDEKQTDKVSDKADQDDVIPSVDDNQRVVPENLILEPEDNNQEQNNSLYSAPDSQMSTQYASEPGDSASSPTIQSWMNRNGVSPIVPEGDMSEHTRNIERKINQFISHVTGTTTSTAPLVFHAESSIIEAEPLLPSETPQCITATVEPTHSPTNKQMMQRHRILEQPHDVARKRRNVDVKQERRASEVDEAKLGIRKPVRYVRRLGRRRIVAGAICQSCFLDGLDEDGNVISSVQVRNVGWGSFKLKRRESINQGEVFEEPVRKSGGLFSDDLPEEREDDDVAQFYGDNMDVSMMEQKLDQDIAQLRSQSL